MLFLGPSQSIVKTNCCGCTSNYYLVPVLIKPSHMRSIILSFSLFLIVISSLTSQDHSHSFGRKIEFPDVPGYQTLKCDLHIHTVFSDGNVWPTIRVEEALRDGLDAIAITDHLEYQPHAQDIPHPDRNRSYEIARRFAENNDILVVPGVEITRDMPPGHANAIFVDDANKILVDDARQAFEEANRQGAYVFWNHPNWISQRKDGIATLTEMHRKLMTDKLLHGIEVVNDVTFSDEAMRIAIENDLGVIGTSDIHGLVDWQFEIAEGGHRPVTLVFAKEKSLASLKEALFAGRTVAWYNNMLVGKEEHLVPLIRSCLEVGNIQYIGDSQVAKVEIKNNADADFIINSVSAYNLHGSSDVFTLTAHSTTTLQVKTLVRLKSFKMNFQVLNAVINARLHPFVTLEMTE